ncbi:MAG: TRAP transporter small permease [Deltaproteobacteria bacterium]|nr:TRAP transporter small permease [Deltaproteobacteria bacterium]
MKKRLLKHGEGVVNTLLVVLMSVMFISVCLQVFFRYVLESPLSWSEELARYAFVWISFLGAAMALGKRLHFGIDYLVNKFPPRLRAGMELITNCAILVFVLVLVVKGFQTATTARFSHSAGLNLRMDIVFDAIPVSGLIMAYYLIRQIIGDIRTMVSSQPSYSQGGDA